MLPFDVEDDLRTAILAPGRPSLAYGELNGLVAAIGRQLRAAGISRDDRIAFIAPNGPEAATGFLAIAGVCQCAPLNPAYRDSELTFYLNDLRPKLVVHAGVAPPEAVRSSGIPTAALQVDVTAPAGLFSLAGLPAGNGAVQEDLSGTALLLHTSGTTSRPKLVPLTWTNLRESAINISNTLRLTPADRCLNVMPLFHIHGLIAAVLATLRAGGSVVCAPGLVAPSFFDWMDEFAPTWYSAVPTMHQSILAQAPRHADSLRRSRLRFVRSSSAPLPVAVLHELEGTFGVPVVEAYGMTEAAHQMTSNPLPPALRKAGSVGLAAGPELTVLGPAGAPAAIGEEGDVCIRGASVTPGYLENVAANQESFRHGWFYTGDLGRIDADGYLFLTGRTKEILNRGGEKISPREVDEILMTHPAVRQCLTFALPDSQLGEEVGVVVVRRDDASVEEAELQHFVAARLADFKVPRRVFFRDDIPTGSTGKLQRIGLAERLGVTQDSWKRKTEPPVSADSDAPSAVAGLIAGVLGLPDVDPHVGFFDAGGDSLLAARLLVRLEHAFGKSLTMVDLFRASSASAIAAKLAALPAPGPAEPPQPVDIQPKLSTGQVQLWLHDQFDDDNLASQTLRLLEIPGSVSADRVRQALVRIVERHEPLRTVIRNDGGLPRGQLRSVEPFPWVIHDWTATPAERRESIAREVCLREAARPFQLDSDLMLRASLHKLGDDRWWLLVLVHHAAIDGWSWQVLRRELQACLAGEPLPPLAASYSDFARWREQAIAGDRLAALKEYWAAQLEGLPPLLELPIEFPRPSLQTYRGQWVSSVLPPSLAGELRDLGRSRGATIFMTLLAGWTCLLGRYSGSSDICVGTPTAGRGKAEFENVIGLFMNTLALRTRLAGEPAFHEVIERVRDTCLDAWDHDLPFEYLKQALPPERSLTHSPYFQVYFQLRNFPRAAVSPVAPVTEVELNLDVVITDLNLEITETRSGLECRLAYNTALFTDRFARAMLAHFEVLLRGAVAAPETCVWRLPIMDAEERATLVSRRLPPQRPLTEATVVELFERQAAERSGEIAVLHRDRRLTYSELNRQANRLARVLAAAGVGPERVVALCMDRTAEWIAAMLAVSKAGGAYMGLEPDYPAALVQDLIVRSRATVVVADERCRETLQGVSAPVIWTGQWPQPADGDDQNPPLAARPDALAHVFFTSGSTGKPKGIATEHRQLSAYLAGYHWMPYSASDTCLQFTSVTFDPSATEVWGPLTHGGRCAVYGEGLDDPTRLSEWIRETGASMCYLSASVFNTLIDLAPDVLRPMRRILIGGEALSAPHIRRGLDLLPRTELVNGYGPTETTLYCTGYHIPRPFDPGRASVPIGRPIDNGCAYVVDSWGQLVPDGLPGELWIGGDTVGRGYLHEPALTAAAFTASPVPGDGRSRVYHTGDRARWLPDGELEYLGRIDHQVKVRGVRIELGEIEAVLREHPAVRHAGAVAVPHPVAGNTLTGFVELQDGASASATELRAFLAGRLPHQMVPARLEIRQALPLTASGKIDRRVLNEWALHDHQPLPEPARKPAPIATPSERRASSSSEALQSRLAEIWRELLGVRDIAADDDFFALGGHSLLAVRMAFEIERQFGRRVTLIALIEASTLSQMADLLRDPEASRDVTSPAPSTEKETVPPMLCVGAGPLFRPFADALAPRCQFHSVPTPVLSVDAGIATMEDLAARMVPSILASHPHGPLMLAGWSLAGVVAVELAVQLQRAGSDVSTVILFDTLSPVRQRQWFSSSPLIRQWQLNVVKARYHVEEALTHGVAGSVGYLMRTLRDAGARTHYDRLLREAAAGRPGELDVPLDFRHAFGPYAARYTPKPLRARIIMVRPERQKRGAFYAGDLGWSELGYHVDLLTVPGDHERMFAPSNAAVLADRLLEKVGQVTGSVLLERLDPALAHRGAT